MVRRWGWAAGTAALLLGCGVLHLPRSGSDPRPATPAIPGLSVEVISGFSGPAAPATPAPERVEILVDVTLSMESESAAGPPLHVASRRAAGRLVRSLPPETAVGLHVVGFADVDGCQPAFRTEATEPGESRAALYRRLDALGPGGEGSLATAVDGLRVFLAVTDTLTHSRVVILTDLGEECGGNLCEAVSLMVAGGARVELVVLGDRPVPGCLADFAPAIAWHPTAAPLRPAFRAERVDAGNGDATRVIGRGDGRFVEAAAGLYRVEVELDPPLRIGPIRLSENSSTRLRIVDFPALDPPVREWTWQTTGEGADAPAASGEGSAG